MRVSYDAQEIVQNKDSISECAGRSCIDTGSINLQADKHPRNYIPTRKDNAAPFTLPSLENTYIPAQMDPKGVLLEENLHGQIQKFQFADHNITNGEKFPNLVIRNYLEKMISSYPKAPVVLELQTWENGLMKSGILNLLEIPHFERPSLVKVCTKLFLS